MKIADVIYFLETIAHPSLQEDYDNCGLLTGNYHMECTGIIVALDGIEEVINEAIEKKCNLVVVHHPIVFRGLKKINGNNYVERTIITAIKNDIAIYAIHTNLDNVIHGVSGRMAEKLGLLNISVLAPQQSKLKKLYTFVPTAQTEELGNALFAAGAGNIGNYSECSFLLEGTGTFKAGKGAKPFVGSQGERHQERETKIEVIFPAHLEAQVIRSLRTAHPYEEPAFDIVELSNAHLGQGAGIVGELPSDMSEAEFLSHVRDVFKVSFIRFTQFPQKKIRRVAVCGGAGSFLVSKALAAGADAYITADMKYHEFFDGEGRMAILDIGHYESEQYTIDLLQERLAEKFPTFAVLKTSVNTNPVRYFGSSGTKANS